MITTKVNCQDMIGRLAGLEPIAALHNNTIRKLAEHCAPEKQEPGSIIFKAGETDDKSTYLISGTVRLTSTVDGAETSRTLESGDQEAKYPLDDKQPHGTSAAAESPCEIVRIDIDMLDNLISEDQLAVCKNATSQTGGKAAKCEEGFFGKLINRLTGGKRRDGDEIDAFALINRFRPPLLSSIPEDDLREICARMNVITVRAGKTVIRQGEEGDNYYVIINGKACVTRSAEEGAEPILLAELGEGETFGEEALLSNAKRNATVTAKTKSTLLCLSKHDFVELLKEPLLKWISAPEAGDIVRQGGKWLDVRPLSDFQKSHLGGAVSMPLHELRNRIGELNKATTFVCCCDTGRLGCSAAFLLSQRGYNTAVLRGGLQRLSEK